MYYVTKGNRPPLKGDEGNEDSIRPNAHMFAAYLVKANYFAQPKFLTDNFAQRN